MNPLECPAAQSPITDPGKHAVMFAGLPGTVDALCQVVHGVYLHYNEGEKHGYKIPEERLPEVNIRCVARMLGRISELDARPLAQPRPPAKRLVGYCRDAAVLFCAMARHQGISARHRVGFATYFNGTSLDLPGSHEIAEVWDGDSSRWQQVDPHLDDLAVQVHSIQFDVCDVPRGQFLVGGKAWQMCRAGDADPGGFGIGDFRGLWFVRNNMLQDLAALNRVEPLNWDSWGLMQKDLETLTDKEWRLLDKVAMLTQAGNGAFEEMRTTYDGETGLRLPRVVQSYSPVGGPGEVTIPV